MISEEEVFKMLISSIECKNNTINTLNNTEKTVQKMVTGHSGRSLLASFKMKQYFELQQIFQVEEIFKTILEIPILLCENCQYFEETVDINELRYNQRCKAIGIQNNDLPNLKKHCDYKTLR
jgi:hypothetical protein